METCGDSCGCGSGARRFYTKAEKLAWMKEYKENLEQETKAVSEKINELEKAKFLKEN